MMRVLFEIPLQLVLLLVVVFQPIIVRAFSPQSGRYVIPNFSYLKAGGDENNNINGDKISTEINNVHNDDDDDDDDVDDNKNINDDKSLLDQLSFAASLINKNKSKLSTPYNKKQIPLSAIPDQKVKFNRLSSGEDDENKRKMDLLWCQSDRCQESVRERVVGDHNTIIFNGPATGQIAYRWNRKAHPIDREESSTSSARNNEEKTTTTSGTGPLPLSRIASVLLLVKRDDEDLLEIAARNVPKLTEVGIDVLLSPDLAAKLKHYYGVDDERISLFEQPRDPNEDEWRIRHVDDEEEAWVQDMNYVEPFPDLVVTLGGDGLLIYASMLFQGPIPPLLAISGGSLGFLTSFSDLEMTDAIKVALGMVTSSSENGESSDESFEEEQENNALQVFPPNMPYKLPYIDVGDSTPRSTFGFEDFICMTIRMRLDCRVVNREGVVRARYNVLNEVVIDRGSSPYLCALECFCDDVHLTTVQADGVIFATPSGSTAYSMAAGGSVVHPAVPCILVTPICPHVLSFRSMVFPDHVVLRCFVPDDARSTASVAFDGKQRCELQRGDSVQIQMSAYPVPTINKGDHSSDWLESLKRSFNFNTRPRQKPLPKQKPLS